MRKYLFLILACTLSVFAWAAERSATEAAEIAAQFLRDQATTQAPGAPAREVALPVLTRTYAKINKEETAYYIFNQGNEQGFIVVSGDDRTEDILMYAEEGHFDPDKINPNMRFWLRHLQEEISAANDSNAISRTTPRKVTTAIAPLLKNKNGKEIAWDQETPYYNLCPTDQLDNTRCLTGCVATAAAQILYKWRYPIKGTGSKTYTWEDYIGGRKKETIYTDLSANFGNTTYDWDNMLPTYANVRATTAQQTAVATLMYHLGVACEMQYGGDQAGGSGAWTDDMAKGLVTYFGYTIEKFVTSYSQRNYEYIRGENVAFSPAEFGVSTATLEKYFNADLEAGRPILMGGEDEDGGHEFVCDGRDANGRFHINWGWEGKNNCYCALTALKPLGTTYDFSTNIDAIIGLQPGKIDSVHVKSVSVSPTNATIKINEKLTLTATVTPADATLPIVDWSSSDPNVAIVNATGVVRGIGQGQTVITATSRDGNKQAAALITVTNEVVAADMFTLVTDASQLKAGDDIIIVATHNNAHYAATKNITTGSTAYMGIEHVEITDNTVFLEDNSAAAIFTLEGNAGGWKLKNSNGYLGATSAKTMAWNDGTQTWTITLNEASYAATIWNATTNYGRILFNYNGGNERFTTYKSTTPVSNDLVLPKIYARSKVTPSIIPVTGVTLGQTSAKMIVNEGIQLYHIVQPATATNKNVTWSSSNTRVAMVNQTGMVTALSEGTTTITITTADGNHTATCLIEVTNSASIRDTIYVTPSEAYAIGVQLAAGEVSDLFYAVTGYVTMPNSSDYTGFWMADMPGDEHTFQGYNCTMPDGYLYMQKGFYVRVFGYLMHYKSQSTGDAYVQIKDGSVIVFDTPSALDDIADSPTPTAKFIRNGRLLFIKGRQMYNALGCPVR